MTTSCLLLLLATLHVGLGAKILAFLPFPARSHHIAFQPILRELALRGHQVDYVTAVPMSNPPKNLKEIKVKDMFVKLSVEINMKDMMDMSVPGNSIIINEMCMMVAKTLMEEEPNMRSILDSKEKYDAVLVEAHFGQEYWSTLCHKFKAPCVSLLPLFDSTWVNEMAGLPDNPSYMIDYKATTTDRLTFSEKLYNIYIWTSTVLVSYYYTIFPMQSLADKYIRYEGWESRPSVLELTRDMALILVNSHHSLGYPYPKAPHVKEVGGINLETPPPLPKDLQSYMDSATNGVVYFSFGSNVDMNQMTKDGTLQTYVNVFKNLKQKVLWKWKGPDMPKLNIPNIKIQEWFPQQSILAHNKTKLFITHGGLMSLIEAINYEVPLLGTAVFGDQPKNLKFVVNAGIGLELPHKQITERSLSGAVNELLSNPMYKKAISKRSQLFKDRPMKPADEAAYWIEYVIKHGNVLQPASVHMPFYQVYLLDVLGAVLAVLILVTYLVKKCICAICCSSRTKTNVQNVKLKKK